MRITKTTPSDDRPPYNTLFDPLDGIIDAIFQERLSVDLPELDFSTYVEMPQAESEIIQFAKSQSASIALVIGSTGIGKSTVLRYVRDKIWKRPDHNCDVLFRDLSDQSYTDRLGDAFDEIPTEKQMRRASIVADEIVVELIQHSLFENSFWEDSIENDAKSFRQFVRTFFAGKIPKSALSGNSSDIDFISAMQDRDLGVFLRIALCYRLRSRAIPHVKIVIDNTDDKDSMLVNSLTEKLAHLHQFVEQFSTSEQRIDSTAPRRCVSPFVACRPATAAHILKHEILRQGGGWYGKKRLTISESAPLYPVIEKRFKTFLKLLRVKNPPAGSSARTLQDSVGAALPDKLKLPLGQRDWTIGNYDSLYNRIFLLFHKSQQAEEVRKICNDNVADSLAATYTVLRNRHFIDADLVFAAAKENSSGELLSEGGPDLRRLFTATTTLRALAYGNQGSVSYPQYPVLGTRIANVISSEHAPITRTTVKPSILSMFVNRVVMHTHALTSAHFQLTDLIKCATKWFGVTKETALKVIDELFKEQLLSNSRSAKLPSVSGTNCELHLTERAWVLWNHLHSDSVLLECYRDVSDLDVNLQWNGKSPNWTDVPTRQLNVNERARQVFWIVVSVWRTEQSEGDRTVRIGDRGRFVELFGDRPISSVLLEGLKASEQKYYSKQSGWNEHGLSSLIEELRHEINEVVGGWGSGKLSSETKAATAISP